MTTRDEDEFAFGSYGDSAILIQSTHGDPLHRWAAVQSLARALRDAALPSIESIVATYDSLVVEFDPTRLETAMLEDWLRGRAAARPRFVTRQSRVVRIPVCYGGEYGPDLDAVAAELGLTPARVIEMHSHASWRVAFNGAPAGAPSQQGSPFSAPIARMPEPRVRIPAGTVALAGFQGTIYTVSAPGGWRLIGRTPVAVVDASREQFVGIHSGDRLHFFPISPEQFATTPPTFIGDNS